MANDLTTNPLFLDTAGATSALAEARTITTIIVNASGDTWQAVLHDAAGGNVVADVASDIVNERTKIVTFPGEGFRVQGLYLTTATDISNVLVYTK